MPTDQPRDRDELAGHRFGVLGGEALGERERLLGLFELAGQHLGHRGDGQGVERPGAPEVAHHHARAGSGRIGEVAEQRGEEGAQGVELVEQLRVADVVCGRPDELDGFRRSTLAQEQVARSASAASPRSRSVAASSPARNSARSASAPSSANPRISPSTR